MKKMIIYNIVSLFLMGMLTGCTDTEEQETSSTEKAVGNAAEAAIVEVIEETAEDAEDVWQVQTDDSKSDPEDVLSIDLYGDYKEEGGEIAFVSHGTVMDGSYNEAIYKGIQKYALAAGTSFSYYIMEEDTQKGYQEVIERAISNQAKIIVCAGCDFQETVGAMQEDYPEVAFLIIDGVTVGADGNPEPMEKNVHCVSFHEEESGYLAGYMAILEGYHKLGFIGGKETPSVVRYGYGYLQGINDAVQDIGAEDVTVNYWYAESFEPDSKIREKAVKWYADGTEVIFSCGGFLYESVLEAAEQENGLLIGVDSDQSGLSNRFLTSAVKDVSHAVVISLDNFYAARMQWSEAFAGQEKWYGIESGCTGIPRWNTEWRFKNVTVETCNEVCRRIRSGEITILNETDVQPQVSFTVIMEQSGEETCIGE